MPKNLKLILIIAFLLLALLAKLSPLFIVDILFTEFLQNINQPFFKELMLNITRLGNINAIYLSVLLAVLVLYLFKKVKSAIFLVISTSGGIFLAEFFKYFIGRPRPASPVIEKFLDITGNNSFPSGHVLFAISFYGFLIFLTNLYIKDKVLKTVFNLIFILIIILMGISRIYLGAHWLSDVLGAYFLGVTWLLTIHMIFLNQKLK